MPEHAILAVDRDRARLNFLRASAAPHPVISARTALEGMGRSREPGVRAAVVSLGLGDGEAFTLIRQMRQEFATSRIPILLLAHAGQEGQIAAGLEMGAVDYLVHPAEPAAVARSLGRMLAWASQPGQERYLRSGGVVLDVDRGMLASPKPAVPLTPCEVEILRWLLTPPGRAYTRRQLLAAHRSSFPPDAPLRAVDVHVASLRKKLGPAGACIRTLRGIGYRFEESTSRPGTVSA